MLTIVKEVRIILSISFSELCYCCVTVCFKLSPNLKKKLLIIGEDLNPNMGS